MAAPQVKACRKTAALIIILCLLHGNPYCRSALKLKICGLYRRGILGQGKIHIYNKAIYYNVYLFVSLQVWGHEEEVSVVSFTRVVFHAGGLFVGVVFCGCLSKGCFTVRVVFYDSWSLVKVHAL